MSLALQSKLLAMSFPASSGCRIWDGSKSAKGYGRAWWQGKLHQAHRLAYVAWKGPIPTGMHVLHKCDNPSCINFEHLFAGTNLDNVRDKQAKNRIPRGTDRVNAKLDDAKVLEIKRSRLGVKSMAKAFGVAPTIVREIRRGIRWPHIRDPGKDAKDETLSWLPVPHKETA